MQPLIQAITKRSLPALAESEIRPSGIRSWVESGSFYIDSQSSSDVVALKNISISEFTAFQAFDFQRFALSSLECMAFCKSEPSRRRAISWPLLKSYYSGFFAGHALLRVAGQALFRLESAQAKKLTEIGRLYCESNFTVGAGTYDLRLIQNADRSFDVKLQRVDESGGAHYIFWRRFHAFLSEISSDVVAEREADATSVVAKIADLQSILTAGGSHTGAWLSNVRNSINYQHQFGAWFPFGADQTDLKYIAKLGYINPQVARLDYDDKKDTLRAFSAANMFIAALSADLATHLVDRTKLTSSGFAHNWRRLKAEILAA